MTALTINESGYNGFLMLMMDLMSLRILQKMLYLHIQEQQ